MKYSKQMTCVFLPFIVVISLFIFANLLISISQSVDEAVFQQSENDVIAQLESEISPEDWNYIENLIASAEYHFSSPKNRSSQSSFMSTNHAQGWILEFNENGSQIRAQNNMGWLWGITLSGYGSENAVKTIRQPLNIRTELSKIEYQWDENLTEWWINSTEGLEQGFTIQSRLDHPSSHLIIELTVNGNLDPVLVDDGIQFQNDEGEIVLTYDQLLVADHAGRLLTVSLELDSNLSKLQIIVDDTNAIYPITIDPWVRSSKLTPSDNTDGSNNFGDAVSVSGNTIVVGASGDAVNGNTNQGSVYVFEKPISGWSSITETAKLIASDGKAFDYFGYSVDIDGDTIVVTNNSTSEDHVYVFEKPVGGWVSGVETAKLSVSDIDNFSWEGWWSVAIDGDVIVIGGENQLSEPGAAYIFEKPIGGWVSTSETAKLTASDGIYDDYFGLGVGIDGDTIVVSAMQHKAKEIGGSVYVFTKPITGWVTITETAKLAASDGDRYLYFGDSVSISGDVIAVGVSRRRSVYVFEKPIGGWVSGVSETAKLTSSDGGSLGYNISMNGDVIVAGSSSEFGPPPAYVFERPGTGWTTTTETAKLMTSDGNDDVPTGVSIDGDIIVFGLKYSDMQEAAYLFEKPISGWVDETETGKLSASDSDGSIKDRFGSSVAIYEDTIAVGMPSFNKNHGIVYLFEKTGNTWGSAIEIAKLTASDGEPLAAFGVSLGISKDTVVVGASKDNDFQGSVYVFEKPNDGWISMTETAKLTASDGISGDYFGNSVSIDADTIVVGAFRDENCRGSAYVFEKPVGSWVSDTESAKLTASDGVGNSFECSGDEFGMSVDIDGDSILVGAPGGNGNFGAAYLFTMSVGGWVSMTETAKISISDGQMWDGFGKSVAIDNDTILIGAPFYNNEFGAAFIFEKPLNGWTTTSSYTAKLTSSDVTAWEEFGYPVALEGEIALIGAVYKNFGTYQSWASVGDVYVYRKPATGDWQTTSDFDMSLVPPDRYLDDEFGQSIAIHGNTIVVGVPGDDSYRGSVDIFELIHYVYIPLVTR